MHALLPFDVAMFFITLAVCDIVFDIIRKCSSSKTEVDWRSGRVTRRRTKTEDHANVPTVTYKLWKATFGLLKKFREPDGDRVLLNVNGQPLKIERLRDDGKLLKIDNIGRSFHRLCRRLKMEKANFKRLRKTSPSMMVPNYAGLRTLFLGNAPREITDRHYTDPPLDALDEVIEWLGRQYGIE